MTYVSTVRSIKELRPRLVEQTPFRHKDSSTTMATGKK